MLRKQRKITAFLWCCQVDATAFVEAEAKTDGGGGARRVSRREEEDDGEK